MTEAFMFSFDFKSGYQYIETGAPAGAARQKPALHAVIQLAGKLGHWPINWLEFFLILCLLRIFIIFRQVTEIGNATYKNSYKVTHVLLF